MGRLVVAAIVTAWIIPISILVNRIVPDPYMDEIFHVPQAQKYCNGDFRSWDPMITTPPGLYYLSLPHVASLFPGMWFLNKISSFSGLCSTAVLRSANGTFAVICSVLVYEILMHLRPALGKRKATACAVLMALYPLHWFFTFLFYTDVASLGAVLAMYLACLKKQYWLSAMLGALSIFIRQTNVVWMLFVASVGAIDYLFDTRQKDHVQKEGRKILTDKDGLNAGQKSMPRPPNIRRRKMDSSRSTVDYSTPQSRIVSNSFSPGLLNEFQVILVLLWSSKWKILTSFFPFIVVLAMFISFVIWNGSLVLGAKEAHTASTHFAQMMYFSLVSAAAMAPLSLCQFAHIWQYFWQNKLSGVLQGLVALIAGFISVHFFSIAHPYLLADNRHYPFYLWRKVINVHWLMKYLLVPLYIYSWLSIIKTLGKTQRKIWVLLFVLACAAVLVPSPLIEFRYYTIPFFFLVLHSNFEDYISWGLMGMIYLTVNIFTMAIFLFLPFHWDHEPGIQRFIW
ncbi:hypothetical protein QJS10_CPA03g01613 [Acorus calamus]|uniref:Dol-P-Glc:Glc(2)Man(9)GlcNAc(2)-PP-Dol alpha-1,2-glucosyltransferase n=1 Tax=Acorus calamus TaxID=4465 RepID=A0AAV9F5N3_ACOCL|nr:hypothetical protein QJS10_CPA03g01613 [Acorus calamus]